MSQSQIQKLLLLWLLASVNPKSDANPGGINLNDPALLNQIKGKLVDGNEDPLFVIHAMQVFNTTAQPGPNGMLNTLTGTSQTIQNYLTTPADDGTTLAWGGGPQCPAKAADILALFP